MMSFRRAAAGFSLIEMMVAVVVIGILASIAIPNYSAYVVKTRRADGKQLVMSILQAQERSFANNLTYTTTLADLGFTVNGDGDAISADGYYLATAAGCGDGIASCVQVTAVPQGPQAAAGEANLVMNSQGTASGPW